MLYYHHNGKVGTMENILTYKGHPLMRSGDVIYYGSLENKYIIVIKIHESKDMNDIKTATKLTIELQLNDTDISEMDRVKKSASRTSLYEAMDIANIWLNKALK